MDKVLAYIEKHQNMYIEWLQEACRQPSVSTQNRGMAEMVELVKKYIAITGANIEVVETAGFPIVYGEIHANKPKTLTFYNHYDVQPEDPIELWDNPPYAANIVDGKLIARGSADNKGNLIARICAIHAYQQVYGELPVNIKMIFEGEEEVGSPHLEFFAEHHPDKVASDGFIWEGGMRNYDGQLQVGLGVKGICYVELRAKGPANDVHSSEAPIVVNPAWRLVWALNTLKDQDERILVEGFYDKVKPLTEQERDFIHRMDFNEEVALKELGMEQFLKGVTGNTLKEKLLGEPTCTICGFESGYTGEGSKTVLPAVAKVKLDFRLVPDQDPFEIADLLRQHLDKHGFEDIEIVPFHGGYPFNSDPSDPLVQIVIEQAEEIYGKPASILRNLAGSSPQYKLLKGLNIPAVQIGVANENSAFHAPNENIYIEDYILGIKMTAVVMHEFGK